MRSTPRADSARGVNGVIGDLMFDGATDSGLVAVASRVQDLQADAPAIGVHGAGDLAMPRAHARASTVLPAEGLEPAGDIRREAAGDHQADAAARALGEVSGEFVVVAGVVLQAGVHRTHQHAIGQGDETQIKRREQMREMWIRSSGCGHDIERLFEYAQDAGKRADAQALHAALS